MDIGLIGFGGVGKHLAWFTYRKRKYLRKKYNLEINLKYIIDVQVDIISEKTRFNTLIIISKGKQIS